MEGVEGMEVLAFSPVQEAVKSAITGSVAAGSKAWTAGWPFASATSWPATSHIQLSVESSPVPPLSIGPWDPACSNLRTSGAWHLR